MDADIGIYRGDTIISFNTIAGGFIRLLKVYKDGLKMPSSSEGRLEVIKNSVEVPYSLKKTLVNLKSISDLANLYFIKTRKLEIQSKPCKK